MTRDLGARGWRQRQERNEAANPIASIARKARRKSTRSSADPPLAICDKLSSAAATAPPNSIATCCSMLDSFAAELRRDEATSAKAGVLSAVNWIERVSPAISISATTSAWGVCGDIAAQAMIDSDAITPHRTETEAPQRRCRHRLHSEIAEEIGKDQHAGIDGSQAEADLEQQRQQEWRGVDATRKMGAGRQCRDGEGLHLESREVEQRIFCARQMPHGQPADQGAGGKQRHGRHGAVFRMGDPLEAVEH